MNFTPMKIMLIVAAIGAMTFGVTALYLIGSYVSVRNGVVEKENELSSTYDASQVKLDTLVAGFYEQFNIAEAEAGKIDQLLETALTARYDNGGADDAGKPVADPTGANGALFSGINEAYPTLNLSYKDVMAYVSKNRARWAAQQEMMQDKVRTYRDYIDTGTLKPFIAQSMVGAPTNRIRAAKGGAILKGEAALEQMEVVIQSKKTKEAFDTGELEPLVPVAPTAPTAPAIAE